MRKRILSLALAICMVAALLPAAVVTAGAAVVSYTYDFNPNEVETGTALSSTSYSSYDSTVLDAEGNEVYSPWQYLISYKLRSGFPQISTSGAFTGILVRTNASNLGRFVIKIKVPTAGTYNVNLQYMGHANSDTPINIYALPAGSSTPVAATAMSDSDKLNTNGALSLWSASTVRDANVDLPGTITTTSDNEERIIVFDVDSWPTAGTTDDSIASYIYLGGLTLSREVQEATTYTVTYNAGEGTVSPANETVEEGSSVTLPTPTRDGYTFLGWSDGTTTYDAGESYTVSGNVTLTAEWKEIIIDGYTFVYDLNPYGATSTNPLDYANTKGLVEFAYSSVDYQLYGNLFYIKGTKAGDWGAVKINVPVTGSYDITLKHNQYAVSTSAGLGEIYILPADTTYEEAEEILGGDAKNNYKVTESSIVYQSTEATGTTAGYSSEVATAHTLTAGEHIVVFYASQKADSHARMYLTELTLATSGVEGGNKPAYVGYVDLAKDSILVGDTTTVEAKVWDLDGNEITDISLAAAPAGVVSVSGTTVEGVAEGSATISASYTGDIEVGNIVSDDITVEFAENINDEEISFIVQTTAEGDNGDITVVRGNDRTLYNLDGTEYEVGKIGNVAISTLIKLTAAETSSTGAKFAYWRIGNTAFNTENPELTYRLNTNTAITAVYDEVPAEGVETTPVLELWGANGALLETLTGGEITADAVAAVTPTFTGYDFLGKWYVAENEELDIAKALASALTRAVAQHSETGVAVGDKNYGDLVADSVDGATYWTRKIRGKEEIVAYGPDYQYYVWDETEIKSYTDEVEAKPVVVLDDYANDAYMIEYFVPEGCTKYEVGILYGLSGEPTIKSYSSKAISAKGNTTTHGQLTAAPQDGETVVRGYLVYLENGVKRVLYTDVIAVGQ